MVFSPQTPCTHTLALFRADELDAAIRTAKGGDTAGEVRRLEDSLKRLRGSFQEAKGLAVGSQEAAAKCQVHLTVRRTPAPLLHHNYRAIGAHPLHQFGWVHGEL